MHRKTIVSRTAKFIKFANEIKSWYPVKRNGWWIKFSTHSDSEVLLVISSSFTGQTLIRYFYNEQSAVDFINYIIDCDPEDTVVQDLPE